MKEGKFFVSAYVFYASHVCSCESLFYYHHIGPDSDHKYLVRGRLVPGTSYQRHHKEIFVDQFLKIGPFRGKLVAEVKRLSKHIKAERFRLAYYLYYFKHKKDIDFEGILLFPKERKN